jgi:hypothetical protein
MTPKTPLAYAIKHKLVHKTFTADDEAKPIPELAAKYGIDVKRLRGRVLRNGHRDPIGCVALDVAYDGWRVRKLAAEFAATA